MLLANRGIRMAFDLDGTLATDVTNKGAGKIGAPIHPMIAKVKELNEQGYEIVILTARVCHLFIPGAKNEHVFAAQMQKNSIEQWCMRYLGFVPVITAVKDFSMTRIYDDRAVQVEYDTGVEMVEDRDRQIANLKRQVSELKRELADMQAAGKE